MASTGKHASPIFDRSFPSSLPRNIRLGQESGGFSQEGDGLLDQSVARQDSVAFRFFDAQFFLEGLGYRESGFAQRAVLCAARSRTIVQAFLHMFGRRTTSGASPRSAQVLSW